jgi:hypothetical protein
MRQVDVSGLTGLRSLEVTADYLADDDGCTAVEGLSGLAALEDLRLEHQEQDWLLAKPSDMAPLTSLTRLASCAAPCLAPSPLAARLRRLELLGFDAEGFGPDGTAAATLAALARGAPLLERLLIRVRDEVAQDGTPHLRNHPTGVNFGAPLGADVAWPSLTHLEVTAWAALLLAACTFPRLSRLVANIVDKSRGEGANPNQQLRTAIAALAAKARGNTVLRVIDDGEGVWHETGVLGATALPQGLRHLSWRCVWRGGAAAAPPGDWGRLAASLESLELVGCLAAFGHAEPLAALTGLTRLLLNADVVRESEDAACPPQGAGAACEGGLPGGAAVRAARALAGLPRLAHLRLTFERYDPLCDSDIIPLDRLVSKSLWGSPWVAAALARCPALRVLEIDRRDDPLWRHEHGPVHGASPRMPRPSPHWKAFAGALRAGGCSAAVRPAPAWTGANAWSGESNFLQEFGVEC